MDVINFSTLGRWTGSQCRILIVSIPILFCVVTKSREVGSLSAHLSKFVYN